MIFRSKTRFLKLLFIFTILFALPMGVYATQNRAAPNTTIIEVNNEIELYGARRFGINIGTYDQYGAAQYLKNVIPNPGLEAGEFAMIFLAERGASVSRVQAKGWHAPWNAQPAGFWDGARYEILSGPAKGRSGTVNRFALDGGKHSFYLNGGGAAPQVGDAVMVRLDHIDGYYADRLTDYVTPDAHQTRPGSAGTQSLRLSPSFYNPAFYISLDSLGRDGDTTAGKLRIVEGNWRVELWAKAQHPGQTLELKFHRVQENIFFKEVIPLSTQWQRIERTFNVPVGADKLQGNSSLSYEIRIASGEGDVWIDDLYLGEAYHNNRTVFSDNYVNILRELSPGILRNWGNQLGSTLQNELSVPTARKTVGHHPYTSNPDKFHYSLHEFLQLSQAVGAEPWYVIPPTFNGQEMQNLVAYLSAPAGTHPYANLRAQLGQPTPWTNIFRTVHLEYGNEMWGPNTHGDPFLGASLSGGARVGEVADGRFEVLRRSPYYRADRLNLIVGGQAFNPWQQGQIEANSNAHDTIGIAPYFGDLTNYGNTGQMYYPLFANPTQQMADTNAGKIQGNVDTLAQTGQGTELAIYEINSHYTYGWTPLQVRNDYLTSMGMGMALPLHMLTYQRDAGINTQAAFTSLQYSFEMPGKGQRAKLWGLLRDIEATQRKRPGWLGLEMANEAIRGNMISTVQSGFNPTWTQQTINKITDPVVVPYVQSFAYKGNQGDYAMVLFNLHLHHQQTVQLKLPSTPYGQATLHTFTANDVRADNETGENVVITSEQRTITQNYTLQLRPHSMYVLEWRGN